MNFIKYTAVQNISKCGVHNMKGGLYMPLDTVNRVMPTSSIAPTSGASDASKNLQNQIMSKEQNLSKISNDTTLDAREKAKKRQELQREIEELNRKLELMRIRQEENEKAAKAKAARADVLKEESVKQTEDKEVSDAITENEISNPHPETITVDDVKSILSSNLILQDELIQQKVNVGRETTERIMQSEIHQDALYGNDTAAQKEELYNTITKDDFLIEAVNNGPENTAQIGSQRIKISITE